MPARSALRGAEAPRMMKPCRQKHTEQTKNPTTGTRGDRRRARHCKQKHIDQTKNLTTRSPRGRKTRPLGGGCAAAD
jgi:hypothetical protein